MGKAWGELATSQNLMPSSTSSFFRNLLFPPTPSSFRLKNRNQWPHLGQSSFFFRMWEILSLSCYLFQIFSPFTLLLGRWMWSYYLSRPCASDGSGGFLRSVWHTSKAAATWLSPRDRISSLGQDRTLIESKSHLLL